MNVKLNKNLKLTISAGALIVVVATTIMMLTSCSTKALTEDVVLGRSVAIDSSNVAFWGDGNYLCSGLVDSSGSIYDFTIESQIAGEVDTVAVFESYLYIAGKDGIFRYSLKGMEKGGTVKSELITDAGIDDGFEIYDGRIYYSYGTSLYSTKLSGGKANEIDEDIDDYDVTSEGIVYTDSDGGIYLLSPDGAENKLLMKTEEDCTIRISDNNIYYRCEGKDDLYRFEIGDESAVKIDNDEKLSSYSYIWANNDYLLYETEAYKVDRIELSAEDETKVGDAEAFPDKHEGFLSGNMLYGYDKYKQLLYEYNLQENTFKSNSMAELLGERNDQQTKATTPAASANYDITEGFIRYAGEGNEDMLDGKYFSITMPNDISWDWEKNSNNSFTIYYTPARKSGQGGTLTTIEAYDWGDSSYGLLPNYKVAGVSNEKIYVAVFPTDVQFDSDDAVQEKEYHKLLSHLKKMDKNSQTGNNPFKVEE